MNEGDRYSWAGARRRLMRWFGRWLAQDVQPRPAPRTDFDRLCEHLRPADVLLVEGRSRVSGVIQSVTLSSWSHAAIYLGRAGDIEDDTARAAIRRAGWVEATQLLLEAEMGEGVHLTPVARYRGEHLRICRPRDLTATDRAAVLRYVCARLDTPYDTRQIFDLLRFFYPYGLLPRHWRSTLFEAGHGDMVRAICSTLLANAFASVRYPILPTIHRGPDGEMIFHQRNGRLITPRDFDYSPYFEIVKYPFFGDDVERYRELTWDDDAPSASRPLRRTGLK
ncbi:YiiX/YebB-like N1pC/P60 family cysteine hydrolase [Salinisphaera sp.]|uniref:YiiX/YebB-like N1pC/P60 family cysteine hydrolase n=1 Tax=Salinisphaera sp. TaxID=1914330 RepID=UPI002D770991|nr:YiiX/YebB-like N1pC/P60 family cysteine hydrolase [Salinisphaera sp.]HET7313816.1 YiiX/YebB-like N1pC/P60 family cysteine hydrolase [Salinisphaera sp.]